MRLSLLYPEGIRAKTALSPGEPDIGKIGTRTLYHFSLDAAFRKICEDDAARKTFLSVLSMPCLKPYTIDYRQEILRVFAAHPDFLNDFAGIFGRFNGLKEGHDREKQAMMRHIHNSTAGASAQTLKNLLQANAVTLKRCLAFIRSLSDLCKEFHIEEDTCKSSGLKRIAREAEQLSASAAFERLTSLCTRIEDMGVAVIDFMVQLGENGQIETCDMIEHKYLHITDPDQPTRRRWFSRRSESEETDSCVRVHLMMDTTYEKLAAAPLQVLAEQIDAITDQIFETFGYIAHEISFYEVAVQYIRMMEQKGKVLTYPRFTEDGDIWISGLHDVGLLVETDQPGTVIPNDMGGENMNRGVIVFGENSSGKTVFLRSVGTAFLLGQAGLPIPASHAEMPICTQIVTQFSEAEKEFEYGNDAGRFEQEVRELAAVVDTLEDGAMVFLNETFQTTAYDEGAVGLYHILRYFSAHNIRYLLVSHLHQLKKHMESDAVGMFRTYSGYKVAPDDGIAHKEDERGA